MSPGPCAGLAIAREDLGYPIKEITNLLLHRLSTQDIRGFYQWARESFNFRPARIQYLNKCDLCTKIRTYLVGNSGEEFAESKPLEFYTQK